MIMPIMPECQLSMPLQQKKPTIIVVGILCSRLLAFFRDVLFAYWLGASMRLDAFLVAFKMPNLARRLLTEGVFGQAILPKFALYKLERDKLRQVLWQALSRVFCLGLLGLIIAEALSHWIIMILAPGFTKDPTVWALATHLLRLTLPVIWFIALTGICTTALNIVGAYTTVAIAPGLMNVVMVAMLIIWVPHMAKPLTWVALSVSFASFMQLLLQVPALIRHQLWWRPSDDWGWTRIKTVVSSVPTAFMPRFMALISAQLGIVIVMGLASFLPAGSISCVYFIDRLTAFPMALIGAVMASVAIPTWTQSTKSAVIQVPFLQYWPNCAWVLRLAIPASVGLFILSAIILKSLFGGAAFDMAAWHVLISGLKITALAITPWLLIKVLASVDFAEGHSQHAYYAALTALIFTLIVGIYAAHRWQVLGILSCLTIAAYINLIGVLWARLQYQGRLWLHSLAQELPPILIACVIMSLYLHRLLPYLTISTVVTVIHAKLIMIAKLLGVIIGAVGIYALVWYGIHYSSSKWIIQSSKRKILRY